MDEPRRRWKLLVLPGLGVFRRGRKDRTSRMHMSLSSSTDGVPLPKRRRRYKTAVVQDSNITSFIEDDFHSLSPWAVLPNVTNMEVPLEIRDGLEVATIPPLESDVGVDYASRTIPKEEVELEFNDDMVVVTTLPPVLDKDIRTLSKTRSSPRMKAASKQTSVPVTKPGPLAAANRLVRHLKGAPQKFVFDLATLWIQKSVLLETPKEIFFESAPQAGGIQAGGKEMVFGPIRFSSGILRVSGLLLSGLIWNFARRKVQEALSGPFDLNLTDFVFKEADLIGSRCIRNGLGRLLMRIPLFQRVDVENIRILVRIKYKHGYAIQKQPGRKLIVVFCGCGCAAKWSDILLLPRKSGHRPDPTRWTAGCLDPTLVRSKLVEIETGIRVSGEGHVLTFVNNVVRPHSPSLPPFEVPNNLDFEMGHNTRILDLDLDSDRKLVRLNAAVTISPHSTTKLHLKQPKDAYGASFTFDVAAWVTRLLKLA
eukprot:CAMPEP_0116857292 /NCGR_PEP_ID=MMETSP0418-20121206/20463_1 /TAXON_ID=1158023 /ORGANISM="Astrosyne radiata, Strain 13vi08-1A" /LENGTH=480 /DNA_ID=CAMNT_0004490941 /DNA_START=431 /DNA_END=1874 /DNA_ORIENTATION=+